MKKMTSSDASEADQDKEIIFLSRSYRHSRKHNCISESHDYPGNPISKCEILYTDFIIIIGECVLNIRKRNDNKLFELKPFEYFIKIDQWVITR